MREGQRIAALDAEVDAVAAPDQSPGVRYSNNGRRPAVDLLSSAAGTPGLSALLTDRVMERWYKLLVDAPN